MPFSYTWYVDRVSPFEDPEFYAPGSVVMVTDETGRSVTVDSEGKRCLIDNSSVLTVGTHYHSAEEFRGGFPNGILPPTDRQAWIWDANGWFDIYTPGGMHLDLVSYTLTEALGDAEDYLLGIV